MNREEYGSRGNTYIPNLIHENQDMKQRHTHYCPITWSIMVNQIEKKTIIVIDQWSKEVLEACKGESNMQAPILICISLVFYVFLEAACTSWLDEENTRTRTFTPALPRKLILTPTYSKMTDERERYLSFSCSEDLMSTLVYWNRRIRVVIHKIKISVLVYLLVFFLRKRYWIRKIV